MKRKEKGFDRQKDYGKNRKKAIQNGISTSNLHICWLCSLHMKLKHFVAVAVVVVGENESAKAWLDLK